MEVVSSVDRKAEETAEDAETDQVTAVEEYEVAEMMAAWWVVPEAARLVGPVEGALAVGMAQEKGASKAREAVEARLALAAADMEAAAARREAEATGEAGATAVTAAATHKRSPPHSRRS